jgi:large conductance mechanosensitive channel
MLPDPKTTLTHATGKAWTLVDEFKEFAFKGNVVDLAIGVIIGGVFHTLIDSLVKNLIMPLIAILIPGERPYTHWQLTIRGSTIHFGLLLGDIVHFLVISAIMLVCSAKLSALDSEAVNV